jgi:hypothetical protein
MKLGGARIYEEGIEIGKEGKAKIRQIVKAIKTLSPTSDVSMRFLKSGNVYEGLLWGKAREVPIGVYKRGLTMAHVLDTLQKKVKKECLKVCWVRAGKLTSRARPVTRHTENVLKPVTLSGVLTPESQSIGNDKASNYKLISYGGIEYFIVADAEWREVLSQYSWEEVKVIGLLNLSNMTLIPQKIYPKGPTGEKEKLIDLAGRRSKDLIEKLVNGVNDLVAVPTPAREAAGS